MVIVLFSFKIIAIKTIYHCFLKNKRNKTILYNANLIILLRVCFSTSNHLQFILCVIKWKISNCFPIVTKLQLRWEISNNVFDFSMQWAELFHLFPIFWRCLISINRPGNEKIFVNCYRFIKLCRSFFV